MNCDNEPMRTNYYYCSYCNVAWEDEWNCACDDECPECGRDFTPFEDEESRDDAMVEGEATC